MKGTNIETASPKERKQIKKACIINSIWFAKQAHRQFKLGNYNLAAFLAITSLRGIIKIWTI